MEEKCGDMVEAVDFSDKGHFGWLAHRESIFLNGETATVDTFNNLSSGQHFQRASCAKFPYKSTYRTGDVSIGGLWGIDEAVLGFNDDCGVSIVLDKSLAKEMTFGTAYNNLSTAKAPLKNA